MIITVAWVGIAIFSLIGLGIIGCCCPKQQQQIRITDTDDEPKRVCPKCGMENPTEANYYGDCGFSFQKPNDGQKEE